MPKSKKLYLFIFLSCIIGLEGIHAQQPVWDSQSERLGFHKVIVDNSTSEILPWYIPDDAARSYDHILDLLWKFWYTMKRDLNGLPYYMNHQVWVSDMSDKRGLGGGQLAMAISSWYQYYLYTGNPNIKETIKFIADYYITHSLSPTNAIWPNIPYPYNTMTYSGYYDGDMILGTNYTQPDKAGYFGYQLVKLYQMTNCRNYLEYAISIANTLAEHTSEGDEEHSPLPFKVNSITGETGVLKNYQNDTIGFSTYTTFYGPMMDLFLSLIELKEGNVNDYQRAFKAILSWMKKYPLQNQKWGPFFEDIPGWSDTQINAVTFALFIMNHTEYFPQWKKDVRKIFTWVYQYLGNKEWERYGVTVINEQTAYRVPGNSHTARQASAEIMFASLNKDSKDLHHAVLQLNWATYMVNKNGENYYPKDDIWLTDGYGDYVLHYLRAMAFDPDLAPADQNHLLSTTGIVQKINYRDRKYSGVFYLPSFIYGSGLEKNYWIVYQTFQKKTIEKFKLVHKPSSIIVNNETLAESDTPGTENSWFWEEKDNICIIYKNGRQVIMLP